MCSVIGIIRKKGKTKRTIEADLDLVGKLVADNVRRGPHAFGVAWIDGDGTLRSYRQPGCAAENMGLVRRCLRDATMAIIHMRWATAGRPEDNENNHPHPCNGGWMIHNGTVESYEALALKHRLLVSSACDSEVIARLMEDGAGSPAKRAASAVRKISPFDPCVILGLWTNSPRMLIARRGNPLWASETESAAYFATRGQSLPGDKWEVQDGRICTLNSRAQVVDKIDVDVAWPKSPPAWKSRFSLGDVYAGG